MQFVLDPLAPNGVSLLKRRESMVVPVATPGGGGAHISDEAYGASWDGVTTVAPSKNAIYDKIEALNSSNLFITVGSADADYITGDYASDNAAIQAAINFVYAAGGGVVFIKTGSYDIESTIWCRNKVTLMGAGRDSTVLMGTSAQGQTAILSAAALGLDSASTITNPLTDFKLCHIKLDGTNMDRAPLNTQRKGIVGNYTLRISFDDVWVYNTPATGFGTDYNVNATFANCIAELCGVGGTEFGYNGFGFGTNGYAEESIQMVNCYAIDCGNNGFLFENEFPGGTGSSGVDSSKDYQLTNCYAIRCNNGFRNTGTSGITCTNVKAIENVKRGFYTTSTSAAETDPPLETTMIGCEARDNTLSGFDFAENNPGQLHLILTGNRSYRNGSYGILAGGDKPQISYNICYENKNAGIYYHPDQSGTSVSNVDISHNKCYNNGIANSNGIADGIRINGGTSAILSATLIGNQVWDDQGSATQFFGIRFIRSVSHVKALGNTVYGNKKGGIYHVVDAAFDVVDIDISHNTVYNNGRFTTAPDNDGIRVMAQTASSGTITDVTITHNRCYDNQGTKTQNYGIAVKDSVTNAQISDNRVNGNLTDGILNAPTSDATIFYHDNAGMPDVVTKTANYTLTSLDKLLLADTTAGDKTMTLPTAVGRMGRGFTIKKIVAANVLTLATTSSQTIDGSTTATVTVNNTALTVVSDDSNWQVV